MDIYEDYFLKDKPEEQPEEKPAEPVEQKAPEVQQSVEPKSMALVLLILQLIGAIPQLIEAAQKLWDWIQQIRNRKVKSAMRWKFRRMVYGRKESMSRSGKTVMSSSDNSEMENEVGRMTDEVMEILKSEQGG